jgi:hypothetical protein
MVYNIQNYWGFGLCPSSDSYFQGTQHTRCLLSPHLRTEIDPVSETLCFIGFRIRDTGQGPETQLC